MYFDLIQNERIQTFSQWNNIKNLSLSLLAKLKYNFIILGMNHMSSVVEVKKFGSI